MLELRVSGYDWDDGNRKKCQQHGGSIAEIEALFVQPVRIAPDPKHSVAEDRLIAVGRTRAGRPSSWPSRSGPNTTAASSAR